MEKAKDNMYYYRYWMKDAALWRYFWKKYRTEPGEAASSKSMYAMMMDSYRRALFFKWKA